MHILRGDNVDAGVLEVSDDYDTSCETLHSQKALLQNADSAPNYLLFLHAVS